MNQTEAIKKAEDRLSLCIHISECSENKGLAKIYGNEAEWLSDVLWTAKQYVQMGLAGCHSEQDGGAE